MKNRNIVFINLFTFIFIVVTISKAVYISIQAYNNNVKLSFENVWVLPILILIVYVILTYFISHPQYLLKKQLSDIENPNSIKQNELALKWKNYYYFYRLSLVFLITMVYFLR